MPWTCISSIEKKKESNFYYYMHVSTKDFRLLTFKLKDTYKKVIPAIEEAMRRNTAPDKLFALQFREFNNYEDRNKGWDIYNIENEFHRMNCEFITQSPGNYMGSSKYKFRLIKNLNDLTGEKLCPSYPEMIMIPANVSRSELYQGIKFRSKNRFPALTYYWHNPNLPRGYSTLWRSAQCLVVCS